MKQRPPFHFPPAKRPLIGRLLGAGAVALALVAPERALAAEADLNPPPPNVLLLVDTSGSMDYKSGSDAFPACHYSGAGTTGVVNSERSRWIDLVEVLTGTISGYQCQQLDRNSALFKTEYTLGSGPPYDFLYPNPYHRPVSNGCVAGPGTLSGNLFTSASIKNHAFDNLGSTCDFTQASDGVLDSFVNDVRFGLMTFDTEVNSSTGVAGLWSYYVGSPVQGHPPACVDVPQEVGVRNPTAPPWEGRAVGFGDPAPGSTDYQDRNGWIQKILLATRPFGATPIAGMLDDARAFMLDDTQDDPANTSFKFGPKNEPAVACRQRAIILLSDGQPNLDLRPYCESSTGQCPYLKSETIAQNLRTAGIDLFVIGFALTQVTVGGVPTSCSQLTDANLSSLPSSACEMETGNAPLQACCSLNRIAAAGGHVKNPNNARDVDWTRARFADSREELRAALSQAIGTNFPETTRTASVPAAGAGFVSGDPDLADFAVGFRFGAAFKPGIAGQGWLGSLTRSRYVCDDRDNDGDDEPYLDPPNGELGDDFVSNVNTSGPNERILFTVQTASPAASTLRPSIGTAVDGAGTNSGTFEHYDHSAQAFVSAVQPAAMGLVDPLSPGTCVYAGVSLNAVQCRDRVLKWLVGLDNGTVNRRWDPETHQPLLVGDFFHSSPRPVAGRPNALLNDASYDVFAADQDTAKRPSVLYASSNDGFLHAFKLAPVSPPLANEDMSTRVRETNELWAFVPPGLLPHVRSSYPGSHELLLDGTPAIKDVVATLNASAPGYQYTLARSKADAQAGAGTWRTILVQSFGQQFPGYFALDVTDPVVDGQKGPKFLWQIITDSAGNQIFGSGGGTPLITTVFIGGAEVAVALLPGGYGAKADTVPASGCPRKTTDFSHFTTGSMPRLAVPCYNDPTAKHARSLTVVRLDTGEILRTFRQAAAEVPTLQAKNLVTVAPLDSPLTGQPVAFPSEVGAIADRVFIGDQDGALWRVNFASASGSPADWKLDLFFDTFPRDGDFNHVVFDGQPIITPPIISVDAVGNLTVAVSTGDQETVGAAPGLANYVWSLVETPNADRTQLNAVPKWHLDFKGTGEEGFRVIGTMALFAGELYFVAMNGPPANANACAVGQGRIYAMKYLEPHASGTAGKGGFVDQTFVHSATADYLEASALVGTAEAFLGGVSIGQEPTCANDAGLGDDEYFKYGAHYALGRPTTGKFQLFVSTGSAVTNSLLPGVTNVAQGGANAAAIDLPNPAVLTRIDSWASIVE